MSVTPFDLRGIRAGKYTYTASTHTISYSEFFSVGDAMTAALELRFAEGRLYAESALKHYRKKVTGGSISIGVDAMELTAQQKMFGAASDSTTVSNTSVSGIKYGNTTSAPALGIGFYAPADDAGGSDGFLAVFVAKAVFGPPSMNYQTVGETIQWATPTTTGEFFLPDKKADGTYPEMLYIAECTSEAQAVAWIKAKLGET